jgi:glutaredoxin-like protein
MAKILDEGIIKQIQEVFADLAEPVEVVFFKTKEDCEYCEETQNLLAEVTGLSDKLSLTVKDLREDSELAGQYNIDKVPAFVMLAKDSEGPGIDHGIRFFGIPAGHEFTTLINDLLLVSRRDSGLSPQTRAYLAQLSEPVILQVFVTPT